jgi:hypothetical protein
VVERESGRYDQRQTQHLQHIFLCDHTLSVKDSVTGILMIAAFRGFNWELWYDSVIGYGNIGLSDTGRSFLP